MKATAIGLILGVAITLTVAANCDTIPEPTPTSTTPATPTIQEDDPNWDCSTMGNYQCGVQLPNGNWYVITFDPATGEPLNVKWRDNQ